MNNVQLMGRLTKDVDLRFTPKSGLAVARFNLAINGIKENDVNFVPVTCFGKTAEIVAQYVKKGDRLLISEGRLNSGSYEKEDGTKVYTLDVIAERIQFIEDKEKQPKKELDMTPVSDKDIAF